MARQDIANMLTGMGGNSNKPNPNMSSADWRMAFGAQQAGAVNRAASGVSRGMFGSAPMTTPQESIAIGMGNLDLGTIGGLQTLGQMQQMRNDTAGAAKTASQIKAMQEKEISEQSLQERRANFIPFLAKEYPNLVSLAQGANPVVTPENYKNFTDKADSLTPDQKNWMLARKQGDKRNFTEWKDRNVANQSASLTNETKNYRIAVDQGYPGTQLEFMDRNVKIGGPNLTNEQKNLNQINKERIAEGKDSILLETYLEKKQQQSSNINSKYQLYLNAVEGGFEGNYLDFAQAEAEATRAPSAGDKARPTAKGADGFLRYTDGAKELLYPEVKEKAIADAQILKETEAAKKESTVGYLTSIGMTELAERVQSNIVTPDEGMTQSNVPPEITKLANSHLEKSMEFGGQSKSSLSLLYRYNEVAPASGEPAAIAREVAAKFGKGGAERLLTFAYGEGRIAAANILLPPGTATEMEVKRSDATQPTITESPTVVRGYLYGRAKKNALAAAQFAALQKHLINFNGNTSTFLESYQKKINDPTYLQKIFDNAGIPPTANYKPKTISGGDI